MKFAQLMEYNMSDVFLEKSYSKCGEKASPRPFYERSKLEMPLNHQHEML